MRKTRRALKLPGMSSTGTPFTDLTGTDALALLRLQVEWGADEALGEQPVDRTAPPPASAGSIRREAPSL